MNPADEKLCRALAEAYGWHGTKEYYERWERYLTADETLRMYTELLCKYEVVESRAMGEHYQIKVKGLGSFEGPTIPHAMVEATLAMLTGGKEGE